MIAHPTDARLYEKAREKLVPLAAGASIELRQSCARLAAQVGRHTHARQFRRLPKALPTLNGSIPAA